MAASPTISKPVVLVAICVMSVANFASGQTHTQHISFDDTVGPGDAGTYNSTDHFSVDLYLTFAGYSASGFDVCSKRPQTPPLTFC